MPSATMPRYRDLAPPTAGDAIMMRDGRLEVPTQPVIPFIEGDGTGPDIWRAAQYVFDGAVSGPTAAGGGSSGSRCFAGEKAKERLDSWLPEDTLAAIDHHLVAIKGPLTTPVGGGFRSLNVALRQKLDLYACVRPVRWFDGRALAGEGAAGRRHGDLPREHRRHLRRHRVPGRDATRRGGWSTSSGTRWGADHPVSRRPAPSASSRSRRRAPSGSSAPRSSTPSPGSCPSVTLVHKGNIMKYTEGGFRDWGYQLAREEYGATEIDGGPWCRLPGGVVIKDVIADAFLQQILTRPKEYSVIATMNLNGDYISDALAAQVGGIGIAPGANINYVTGHAVFEATHGTAPKYAGQDKVNPGSVILSRRDDVPPPRLERGRRPDRGLAGEDHRAEAGHLRLRAADAGATLLKTSGVRARRWRKEHEVGASLPSLQPAQLPPVLLRRPALVRHERGVERLELERHRLPGGPALGFLLVQLGRS